MHSAPAPGTGTIGHEPSEECSNGHAFEYFCSGDAFLKPSFREIIEREPQHTAYANGNEGSFKMCRAKGPFQPAALGFYFQWFKFHVCKYIDV